MAFAAIMMAGCSKESENEVIITNLSGYDWYKTEILYTNSTDKLEGYTNVGNVKIGESCSVETDCSMVVVKARDARGGLVMTSYMDATNCRVTVEREDIVR